MMRRLLTSSAPWDDALDLARERGVLPSALSSREGRAIFKRAARARAVFSARTTSAAYLQEMADRLERLMEGGYEADLPTLRLELKGLLRQLGYSPEAGFPGDAALGIPPAEPGSLRDLSSDRRLNLILTTQERLMRGAAQQARGLERIDAFPAWELVRTQSRRVPRGEMGTIGWGRRWVESGGPAPVIDYATGRTRLIARKDDAIWAALGDSSRWDDALDVDHPPFAFNSGMGWREIARREWDALVERGDVDGSTPPRSPARPEPTASVPPAELPKGLSPDLLARLRGMATPEYRAMLERRMRPQ